MSLTTKLSLSKLICLFILFCLITQCHGTLSKSKKKKKDNCKDNECNKNEKEKNTAGPVDQSVFTKGLVSKTSSHRDIVDHYQAYFDDVYERKFLGDCLGYVTPWNSHGYDVAKIFPKFTMISPVWLQIRQPSKGKFQITGTHDIDESWLKDVRAKNHMVNILPRMLMEGWSGQDFFHVFNDNKLLYKLVEYIVNFLEERQFDGMVLELWSQFGGNYKTELRNLIKELGEGMMARRQKLILVIPPPLARIDEQGMFTKDDFDVLAPIVDGFSLMTYDYTHYGEPGPVAPYQWMKECIENLAPKKNELRQKILLGMNFYGYSYRERSPTPIVGHTYIEMLKKYTPKLKWLKESREHKIEYKEKKTRFNVFFPTLQSIEERIQLAREMGTGLSIWEIGQGLDYFYDLL